MRKYIALCIALFIVGACSKSGNNQPKTRQESQSAVSTNSASPQSTSGGTFTFQINGEKYTATSTKPSMYVDDSKTSSQLGLVGKYKTDNDSITLRILINTKKGALKPGTYTLGHEVNGNGASYTRKKEADGKFYTASSQKGTCVITAYKKTGAGKGIISGHFQFKGQGRFVGNSKKEDLTVKGTFKDVPLL